jgi:hypothetical protein
LKFGGLGEEPLTAYYEFMANPLPPGIPQSFWDDYRKRIEADIEEERKALVPLESGHMQLKRREGNDPWIDFTQHWIAHHKRTIEKYEAMLAALKKGQLL